jgi:hypothetical protein
MKVITHMRALWAIVQRYHDNPYVRGQVERSLGILLLAEGFLGLENPLDGKKSRPGIFGALLMTIIGVAFLLFFNSFSGLGPVENEVQIQGQG